MMSSAESDPRAQLAARLARMRVEVGRPSYRDLHLILKKVRDDPVSASTLSNAENNIGTPKLATVIQFVTACRHVAENNELGLDPALFDPEIWRGAWRTISPPDGTAEFGGAEPKSVARQSDTASVRVGGADPQARRAGQVEQLDDDRRVDSLGQPLNEVSDPFVFEVHRPITVDGTARLPPLPPYVRRAHDDRLTEVVRRVLEGNSAMVVLVGGSSVGKTRALWEALHPVREVGGWRLWHPWHPSRRGALDNLQEVQSRTVIWLNETQEYLGGPDGGDEHAAAALRDLLADSSRAPVLIVGTLWPVHYEALCRNQASRARMLLEDRIIEMPDGFTDAELTDSRDAAAEDPRLAMAFERAEDGRITQYLAGGPELIRRYRFSSPPAKALLEVAMDARRMGCRGYLPRALLEDAANAYMSRLEWDALDDENWFEKAVQETSRKAKGARGPLTRIRPRPGVSRADRRTSSFTDADRSGLPTDHGPEYVLADYLDQFGRTERIDQIPPIRFWEAVARHAHPQELNAFAHAARDRGLYRVAAQLWKAATANGDDYAASELIRILGRVHPQDGQPAEWVINHVGLGDGSGTAYVVTALHEASESEQVSLLARRAATEVFLDHAGSAADLVQALHKAGQNEQVSLLARRAATQVSLDDSNAVTSLASALHKAGEIEQVRVLARRVASRGKVGNIDDAMWLRTAFRKAGVDLDHVGGPRRKFPRIVDAAHEVGVLHQVGEIAELSLDNAHKVTSLLRTLHAAGESERVRALARRATTEVALNDALDTASLVNALQEVGESERIGVLARRAVTEVSIDNAASAKWVVELVTTLQAFDATEHARALAHRVASEVSLDTANGTAELVRALWEAGETEQVSVLARRAAAEVALDDAIDCTRLVAVLQEADEGEQARLLARRGAIEISPEGVEGVIWLLGMLQEAGESELASVLARRAAAEASLAYRHAVTDLARALRKAGEGEQARVLARRAVAEISLDNANSVAHLVELFWEADALEEISGIASHAAATVALDRFRGLRLLDALRKAGQTEQATALVHRFCAVGMFSEFLRHCGNPGQFRFGRAPDGRPADPWTWKDLQ